MGINFSRYNSRPQVVQLAHDALSEGGNVNGQVPFLASFLIAIHSNFIKMMRWSLPHG